MTIPLVARCSIATALLIAVSGPPVSAQDPDAAPAKDQQILKAGEFLQFDVVQKRLLRRTNRFLDVDRIDRQLQVAIVIDGTESMQAELQNLKENLRGFVNGLREVRQDPIPTVSVALIAYRDNEPAVEPLIDAFESDLSQVDDELLNLKAQSGAPFFREAVDQGLHYAITRLNWLPTSVEGISRWIIIAGDAPPYPEGSQYRKFSNQTLIDLANEKQIAIYGIATGSGFVGVDANSSSLRQTAEKERPDLRSFLGELARATGGHTVDTLDANAVRYWMTHKQLMEPISPQDIEAMRRSGQSGSGDDHRLKIAVLPHLPLGNMSFESHRPEVLVATHLRDRLARLGGIEVVSGSDLQRAYEAIEIAPDDREKTIGRLCRQVDADYLVWGTQSINFNFLVLETGLYHGADGTLLTSVNDSIKPASARERLMIVNSLFRKLCTASSRALARRMQMAHAEVFEQTSRDSQLEEELLAPFATDPQAQSAILAALDQLEQSLAVVKDQAAVAAGTDAARGHLEQSICYLEQALAFEPANPYVHLLLADAHHNLSRTDGTDGRDSLFLEHLSNAFHLLDHLPSEVDPIRLEIDAQYSLLVVKDVEAAIRQYRELAGRSAGRGGRFDLRSHWMLAGIHLGEWDAVSYGWDYVDPAQAREHILAILAFWPDSPEARFYQDCIRNSAGDSLSVPVGDAQLAQSY